MRKTTTTNTVHISLKTLYESKMKKKNYSTVTLKRRVAEKNQNKKKLLKIQM